MLESGCLQPGAAGAVMISLQKTPPSERPSSQRGKLMNTIIYIVGLIVIIGVILSFFGLR